MNSLDKSLTENIEKEKKKFNAILRRNSEIFYKKMITYNNIQLR